MQANSQEHTIFEGLMVGWNQKKFDMGNIGIRTNP
jgi:hypothetical protein